MNPLHPDPLAAGESLDAIRGYLLHLAHNHLDADLQPKGGASDLVQAALLAAHARRDQYRGDSPEEYRGWVRKILLNVVRKFRRRWRTETRRVTREQPLDDGPRLPAHRETPSHVARQDETRRLLADAVARLDPEQRQVVAWRFEDGLTFAEIADRLGKSQSAARVVFQAALGQLNAMLRGAS